LSSLCAAGYNRGLRAVRLLDRRLLHRQHRQPSAASSPNTIAVVKENEPFEVALRRFKRTIEKSGLLTELRAREFYEKPTAERKRKKSAAIKRHFKRLRSQMLPKKMY